MKRLRPVLLLWLPPFLWMTLIFALSSMPSFGPMNWWFSFIPMSDKIAHFIFYGVLGFLLSRAAHFSWGWSWKYAVLFAIVVSSLYGASDEWHQSFVPGRDVEVADWAADTLGAALAQVACYLFYRRKSDRKNF